MFVMKGYVIWSKWHRSNLTDISLADSHHRKYIEEKIYDPPMHPDALIGLAAYVDCYALYPIKTIQDINACFR